MSTTNQPDKQRGFVPLDIVIRSAMADIQAPMSRYEHFKHFAIAGYNSLQFDLLQEVKTVRLPLTAWKALETPTDYVDWVMIGVELNNAIQVFLNDDRIPLPTLDEDHDGALDPPTVEEATPLEQLPAGIPYYFWNYNKYGEDKGELYGLTAKDNGIGYFKVNKERNEIQFSPSINGDTIIYLEYISNGFNPCEQTVVTVQAARLIQLFIHWQRLKHSKYPRSHVKEAKDDYWAEYRRVQDRLSPITVPDVLECARDGYSLVKSF